MTDKEKSDLMNWNYLVALYTKVKDKVKEGLNSWGLFGKSISTLFITLLYEVDCYVNFLVIERECWTGDLSLVNLNWSLCVNFYWLTIPLTCLSIECFMVLATSA